jgi:hypothetical protein
MISSPSLDFMNERPSNLILLVEFAGCFDWQPPKTEAAPLESAAPLINRQERVDYDPNLRSP